MRGGKNPTCSVSGERISRDLLHPSRSASPAVKRSPVKRRVQLYYMSCDVSRTKVRRSPRINRANLGESRDLLPVKRSPQSKMSQYVTKNSRSRKGCNKSRAQVRPLHVLRLFPCPSLHETTQGDLAPSARRSETLQVGFLPPRTGAFFWCKYILRLYPCPSFYPRRE